MQDDAGKTPETSRWWWYTGAVVPMLVYGVNQYDHQIVLVQDEVAIKLNHLEGALREAEAKAALADKMELRLRNGKNRITEAEWLTDYDALQQPKAGAS